MNSALFVIAAAVGALVLIYFLPWLDERFRKMYGRWRRKQRDLREGRLRQTRTVHRAERQ